VILVQAFLLAVVTLAAYLSIAVFHAAWWIGALAGVSVLGVLWMAYLLWQGAHPEWWAPWDEGLPQETRMMNAFVPVLMIFVAAMCLLPSLVAQRQRNLAHRRDANAPRSMPAPAAPPVVR
jgi:hypothetical protein